MHLWNYPATDQKVSGLMVGLPPNLANASRLLMQQMEEQFSSKDCVTAWHLSDGSLFLASAA